MKLIGMCTEEDWTNTFQLSDVELFYIRNGMLRRHRIESFSLVPQTALAQSLGRLFIFYRLKSGIQDLPSRPSCLDLPVAAY